MTSVRRCWNRFACWVTGNDPPKAVPKPLPHPTDLAGLYEACDIAEHTLEHTPYYEDAAIEARRDTLWLARALAVPNTALAMHMLRMTATSSNIWGDHNQPLIETALTIGQQTAARHPEVAAQFASLACKMCMPGDADEQTALQDLETYLPACARLDPQLACQLAEDSSRHHHGAQADALVREGLHKLEAQMTGKPVLQGRLRAAETRFG